MGLFSFLKDAGEKIFKTKAKAEAKAAEEAAANNKLMTDQLLAVIDSHGFEINNLSIDLNDDVVTVFGETECMDDKEKIVLSLGNVRGIAAVDDRISLLAVENAPEHVEAVFYEVQKGDTLGKIAKAHYGNAMKYPVIFEANKPMLTDVNKIYPGQMLRIPAIEA